MVTTNTIQEKPTGKQDEVCPKCGMNQQIFREMFGIADDEPTGCEKHEGDCPICSKRLED